MDYEKMIQEIERRKDAVLRYSRTLKSFDPNDHYWSEPLELAKKNYFFETSMVINWIGIKFRPQRILEIGTRTGASLIALLSTYKSFEGLEIYCFDLWREYHTTTLLPQIIKYFPPFLKRTLSIRKVKRNLHRLNIPSNNIQFITGDSKVTLPRFFLKFPNKKFDYILVDGGHDRIIASTDLENVSNHIAQGGLLVFDDIGPESYQLIDVWEAFKNNHTKEFKFYEKFHRKGVAWAFKK